MKLHFVLIAAIVINGCSNSDSTPKTSNFAPPTQKNVVTTSNPLIGKWVIDPEFIASHKDANKDGFLTGMAGTFWFEFNEDKSFRGSMTEGNYVYAEGVVNLLTTKMAGKALEQDGKAASVSMPGELSKDGKKLTLHPQQTDLLPASIQTGIVMARSKT
ncbi:MAG: hypothetical protein WCG75_07240 [Armatimonadota bacterium]